jgi:hypothetical protein
VEGNGAERRIPVKALAWPLRLAVKAKLLEVAVAEPAPQVERPSPPPGDVEEINEGWSLGDEVERQDEIARTVLPASLAGSVATASLGFSGAGQYRPVLVGVALALSVPALLALAVLATVPYARDHGAIGPRLALDYKMTLNGLAVAALVLVIYGGVAGGLVTWWL